MIKLSYEQIVGKIQEHSSITDEELESKITDKLQALSGLISKEGAAHIVANELGVKLLEQASGKLQIKNIVSGMRDVEVVAKVLRKYDVKHFNSKGREGKVGSMVVGDETGTIRAVMWGDQTDSLGKVNVGDVVKFQSGYVKDNNNGPEIHLNERASCIVNPEGETVGEVAEIPSTGGQSARKSIKDLNEQDRSVEILGTVMQVFEPRFYEVCPDCNRRVRVQDGAYVCSSCGRDKQVVPDYGYVVNAIIDDGSESIRSVFFREAADGVLGVDSAQVAALRENMAGFDALRGNVQGSFVKVQGRVNRNTFFDRLEFVANNVELNPSGEKELERLKAETVQNV